jgi:hypothetical protein
MKVAYKYSWRIRIKCKSNYNWNHSFTAESSNGIVIACMGRN